MAQAWNFMSWLMSDDAQQKVFADNNDTASSISVLENGYASADERTRIANATIKDGRARSPSTSTRRSTRPAPTGSS
ncbi:hypothetical protein [Tessaracoccus coleopterorum]|uniref:hypothetical protein n=1 Tax=Tessaracoccus coleopterorum TaxID=2714950 RepID=UPI002F914B46